MSKNWYPMINYENCIECGACIEKCSHGVYDEEKAPSPKVVSPEECVEGCTGCASLCPAEAITYFGDSEEKKAGGCCDGDCNCGCGDDDSDDDCGCGDGGCGCGGSCC